MVLVNMGLKTRVKRVLYDTAFMEVGLLPRERTEDPADDAPKTDETGQKQPVSSRVREAATCIQEVMREQGLKMDTLDPYGDFNPEVRELLDAADNER